MTKQTISVLVGLAVAICSAKTGFAQTAELIRVCQMLAQDHVSSTTQTTTQLRQKAKSAFSACVEMEEIRNDTRRSEEERQKAQSAGGGASYGGFGASFQFSESDLNSTHAFQEALRREKSKTCQNATSEAELEQHFAHAGTIYLDSQRYALDCVRTLAGTTMKVGFHRLGDSATFTLSTTAPLGEIVDLSVDAGVLCVGTDDNPLKSEKFCEGWAASEEVERQCRKGRFHLAPKRDLTARCSAKKQDHFNLSVGLGHGGNLLTIPVPPRLGKPETVREAEMAGLRVLLTQADARQAQLKAEIASLETRLTALETSKVVAWYTHIDPRTAPSANPSHNERCTTNPNDFQACNILVEEFYTRLTRRGGASLCWYTGHHNGSSRIGVACIGGMKALGEMPDGYLR